MKELKELLIWLYKFYPRCWAFILPDIPSRSRLSSSEISACNSKILLWRKAWQWTGGVALVFAITTVGLWQGKLWFINFLPVGISAVLVTAILSIRFPIRPCGNTLMRRAVCGIICIWVPFLVPSFYHMVYAPAAVEFSKLPTLWCGCGNPWRDHRIQGSLTCAVLSLANLLFASAKW